MRYLPMYDLKHLIGVRELSWLYAQIARLWHLPNSGFHLDI